MADNFLKCFYNFQIASPTTYEISAPVPSHLAYTAKISYQQPIQYTPQLTLNQVQNSEQTSFKLFPQQKQPIIYQPPPEPKLSPVFSHPQIFQIQPQYPFNERLQQPETYFRQELIQQPQLIPGIIYAQQSENQQAPTLREFKDSPPPNIVQKAVITPSAPLQVSMHIIKLPFFLLFSYFSLIIKTRLFNQRIHGSTLNFIQSINKF